MTGREHVVVVRAVDALYDDDRDFALELLEHLLSDARRRERARRRGVREHQ